jgi:hypothetical protein
MLSNSARLCAGMTHCVDPWVGVRIMLVVLLDTFDGGQSLCGTVFCGLSLAVFHRNLAVFAGLTCAVWTLHPAYYQ